MSDVLKRCPCDEPKQPKCPHPWYMKKFIYQGTAHQHNVSRWALALLNETITTRTRADEVVEQMRILIRAGQFTTAKAQRAARPKADPDMTLAQLVAAFDRAELSVSIDDVDACTDETLDKHRACLKRLADFEDYGSRAAKTIDTAALIAFRTSAGMRSQGRSSWAKYRGIYNRLFRFGKRTGVIAVHPFDADVASEREQDLLKRRKSEPRTRRLKPGEEARLLRAALAGRFEFDAQRLHDLIVGALETAARRGELLALRWADVELPTPPAKGVLTIAAIEDGAGKTGARIVPISNRFRVVLLRRRVNTLTGTNYPESAYVFGNETGERVTQVKAWQPCVVRAHGQMPDLKRGNLTAAGQALYKAAGLHFHDLRRECASRWLESKVFTLMEIRDLLGHSNIAQTSEYLAVGSGSAIDAMRAYDEQRALDAREAEPVAVGAIDCKSTATSEHDDPTSPKPRLVKGRKASADR